MRGQTSYFIIKLPPRAACSEIGIVEITARGPQKNQCVFSDLFGILSIWNPIISLSAELLFLPHTDQIKLPIIHEVLELCAAGIAVEIVGVIVNLPRLFPLDESAHARVKCRSVGLIMLFGSDLCAGLQAGSLRYNGVAHCILPNRWCGENFSSPGEFRIKVRRVRNFQVEAIDRDAHARVAAPPDRKILLRPPLSVLQNL